MFRDYLGGYVCLTHESPDDAEDTVGLSAPASVHSQFNSTSGNL